MKSKKALLIYPPNQLMDVETPRPDGSLGLLYLASALESKGIETDVLDASVGTPKQSLQETFYNNIKQENGLTKIGMSFSDIANYVTDNNYDVVGISSNFTPQTKMAFETASAIKKANPQIEIYAGGVNARALKERFLKTGYFNGICLTEGELNFPRAILNGVEKTPGFAYIENNEIKENPVDESCFPKTLDDLVMPAWEKLAFDKYEKIASPHGVDVTGTNHKYAPIMTSRGCIWKCMYCHISTEKQDIGKLRTHSIERVIQEIEKLDSLGIKRVFFEDDTLFAKKDRAKEIFTLMQDKDMSISNVNGINLIDLYSKNRNHWGIDKDFLHILKNSGFDQMVFPAESGNQRILDTYASGKVKLDKMNLPDLMKAMRVRGIKAPVNMMIGFPDENEVEINQSIDLAHKLMDSGAPYVTFFIPIPFPGSVLYNVAINGGYLDKDFDTDIFNWKRPVMKNTIVSPERLEEIRDKANEEVNTKNHIEMRLKQSMGFRIEK
tara:strand:+ start:59 stop:1546 length:1488 start_codon:yes stop_codon:yes gene_type:complete